MIGVGRGGGWLCESTLQMKLGQLIGIKSIPLFVFSAVVEEDPFTRLKIITKWYIAGFYKKPKVRTTWWYGYLQVGRVGWSMIVNLLTIYLSVSCWYSS